MLKLTSHYQPGTVRSIWLFTAIQFGQVWSISFGVKNANFRICSIHFPIKVCSIHLSCESNSKVQDRSKKVVDKVLNLIEV